MKIETKHNRIPDLLFLLVIAFMIPLAYWKVFHAGFISWDDKEVLVGNRDVHHFDWKAFFSKHYVGNYAPVTMISFAIDWFLFKANPVWQHTINLVFHFINVVLIFRLSKLLLNDSWKAFLISVIFCFHPTQIETVAWVAAKNNLVYAVFFLLAFIFYVRYHQEKVKRFYVYAFVLFILSTLSKPSAIAFPLCLFAIDYVLGIPFSLKTIWNKIPFFIVALIIGIVTIYTRTEDKFITYDHAYTIPERIGFAGYAIFFYFYKFLIPIHLSVVYPYPQDKWPAIIFGYFILIVFISLVIYLLRNKKYPVIGAIGLIIANLILVLQFIPFGEVIAADRYMYLTLLGFALLLVFSLKWSEKVLKYVSLFLLISYSSITFFRVAVWQNSIALYSDIIDKYPDSFLALNSLGAEYMLQGNTNQAYLYLNKAIGIAPAYYKGYYNRGLLNAQNHQMQEALNDLTKAIDYHKLKSNVKAYVARANVYYTLKDFPKAMADAQKALALDPENIKACYLLATCYDDLNQLEKALTLYHQCLKWNPEEPLFYMRRAICYGKLQNFKACLADLDTAIQLSPDDIEAYYWRGVAKVNLNQNPCSDFQKASSGQFDPAKNALYKYCH